MENSRRKTIIQPNILVTWLICAIASTAWGQQVPVQDVELQRTLPIDLDADSSEFDRKNNLLKFKGLRIRQGVITIEADTATAAKLDFENTRWEFTDNVVITGTGTKAYCDRAEVLFSDHRISSAIMHGIPVRFSQKSIEDGSLTQGHADVMDYDIETGVIRMSKNAWLSDGKNEVSSDNISYDLVREYIIADSNGNGPVRMKIIPPEDKTLKSGTNE